MKNLSLLSKEDLLNHAKHLVAEDRKISLQLIDVLRECEKRMLYAELGYGSLWQFAVEHLGLSEGAAQLRISAMRLTRENPHVKASLESGKLSLSNAAQLQSFFQAEKKQGKVHTSETKKEIIERVSGLSKKECERHLLALAPESVPQEKERVVSENKTELRLVLDNSVIEKLERLKNLLAHQFPRGTYGELIDYPVHQTLEQFEKKKTGRKSVQQASENANPPRPDEVIKLDQSETSQVAMGSIQRRSDPHRSEVENSLRLDEVLKLNSSETDVSSEPKKARPFANGLTTRRVYIPVSIQRLVWQRSRGRCEHLSQDGRRCESRHRLQLDHILPLANHGTNRLENLRHLCQAHNIFEAQKKLGTPLMQNYVPSLR